METAKTPEFRVSFPNVFKPSAFPGQEPKYGVTMLFAKTADISALKKMAKAAVEAKWPDPVKRPKNLRNPFRDGDIEKPDTDGYAGMIFIRANSKIKPGVVDRNVQPIVGEEEFYAGCYARATVTCYAYDQMGNTGVAFGLQNIQKLRDGDPFSGRKPAESEFEDLGDDPTAGANAPAAAVKPTSATDMFA